MNAGLALLIIDYPQANPKELRAAREYIRAAPQEQYEEEIAATITLLRAIGNAETFTDPLTGMLCVNAIDTDDIVFKAFAMRAMPSAPESAPDAKPAPPSEGSATVATGIEDRLRVLNAPPVAPTDEERRLELEYLRCMERQTDNPIPGDIECPKCGKAGHCIDAIDRLKTALLAPPAPPVAPVRVKAEVVKNMASKIVNGVLDGQGDAWVENWLDVLLDEKGVVVDGEGK